MKQQTLRVTENIPLTDSVYRMTLESPDLEEQQPGRFVNIRLDGLFLRRPISVCDSDPGRLVIIYKTVGKGTEKMSRLPAGATDTIFPKPGKAPCCWAAAWAFRRCSCWPGSCGNRERV